MGGKVWTWGGGSYEGMAGEVRRGKTMVVAG